MPFPPTASRLQGMTGELERRVGRVGETRGWICSPYPKYPPYRSLCSTVLSTLLAVGRTLLSGKLGLPAYLKHTARRGIGTGNIEDVSLNRKPPFLQLLLCGFPATMAMMTATSLEIKGMAGWGVCVRLSRARKRGHWREKGPHVMNSDLRFLFGPQQDVAPEVCR